MVAVDVVVVVVLVVVVVVVVVEEAAEVPGQEDEEEKRKSQVANGTHFVPRHCGIRQWAGRASQSKGILIQPSS